MNDSAGTYSVVMLKIKDFKLTAEKVPYKIPRERSQELKTIGVEPLLALGKQEIWVLNLGKRSGKHLASAAQRRSEPPKARAIAEVDPGRLGRKKQNSKPTLTSGAGFKSKGKKEVTATLFVLSTF